MTDAQKLAVKKFLYSVKYAVMSMDIDCLKDNQLITVLNGFKILSKALNIDTYLLDSEGNYLLDSEENYLSENRRRFK